MLTKLTRETPNRRFIVSAVALYTFCMTAGSLIPVTSPVIDAAPFVKLALVPFAQWFLIDGARHRYSEENSSVITYAASFFYLGLIVQTLMSIFS